MFQVMFARSATIIVLLLVAAVVLLSCDQETESNVKRLEANSGWIIVSTETTFPAIIGSVGLGAATSPGEQPRDQIRVNLEVVATSDTTKVPIAYTIKPRLTCEGQGLRDEAITQTTRIEITHLEELDPSIDKTSTSNIPAGDCPQIANAQFDPISIELRTHDLISVTLTVDSAKSGSGTNSSVYELGVDGKWYNGVRKKSK